MKRIALFLTLALAGFISWDMPGMYASAQNFDPNFYVFLSVGGSNMEGKTKVRPSDKQPTSTFTAQDWERFRKMVVVEGDEAPVGSWVKAVPPVTRPDAKLGLNDYIGRILVTSLEENITVGVVPVAVDKCAMDVFSKDQAVCSAYLEGADDNIRSIAAEYGGYPYGKLVEMARTAQASGVIKGIFFHQGETDANGEEWLQKVYELYANLIQDLNLSMDTVPFIAGEPVRTDTEGPVKTALEWVDKIPEYFKTMTGKDVAYVASSEGCSDEDGYSFKATGYNKLSRNYSSIMVPLLERFMDPPVVDPNFFVFLGIGQSNMQGKAPIETRDLESNSNFTDDDWARYYKMNVVHESSRKVGKWATAKPPIVRPDTELGVTDYFGRYLVKGLDPQYKVGVVVLAVDGCSVRAFSKDESVCSAYLKEAKNAGATYVTNAAAQYGNYPYGKLVEMAKKAQQTGVIKGIIYHQGETDAAQDGDVWLARVYELYTNLINDLGLDMDKVPFIAGEPVQASEGGACSAAIPWVDKIPAYFKQQSGKDIAYVVSSKGCTKISTDVYHFSSDGYREMGKRYGQIMLPILLNDIQTKVSRKYGDQGYLRVFDLNGRSQESLKQGLNIIDGKKVLIR
jgi:hypothetical protein